jgi:hypothetical protein
MAAKQRDQAALTKRLVSAARRGDVNAVRRLLEQRADPNARPDDVSPSALWAAIYNDQLDVLRAMAGSKADFNTGRPERETPLTAAARAKGVEMIRTLVACGAEVNRPSRSGQTPLKEAVEAGRVDVAAELVRLGADPKLVPDRKKYPDASRESPLRFATDQGDRKMIAALTGKPAGAKPKPAGKSAPAKAPPKTKRSPTPRGVTTFDTEDAAVLVAADVARVAAAFARHIGGRVAKPQALGQSVKLTNRCYCVWKIAGTPWSIVQRAACEQFEHWPSGADALALSKALGCPALFVANSDAGGAAQFARFRDGKLVELIEDGTIDSAAQAKKRIDTVAKQFGARDAADLVATAAGAGRVAFASTERKLDPRQLERGLDAIDRFVREHDAFVPFFIEPFDGAEPGETVELILEGFGPDDVERLDFVTKP